MAPSSMARSSFAATRSTATIRDAPAITAPITADSPTPPRPMTATLDPAGYRGGLGHRADTGRDAAADQCRDLRGDAVRHRDRRGCRNDDALAERCDPAVGQDVLPVAAAERRPAVRQAMAERSAVAAQPLATAPALRAAQARGVPGQSRPAGRSPGSGRPAPAPRRCRRPRGPGPPGRAVPTRRRERGGPNGRPRRRASGPGSRPPGARRARAPRSAAVPRIVPRPPPARVTTSGSVPIAARARVRDRRRPPRYHAVGLVARAGGR